MTVTPIHHAATPRRARTAQAVPPQPNDWSFTIDVSVSGAADPALLQLISDLHRLVTVGTGAAVPEQPDRRALRIDTSARSVTQGGRPIVLSRLEFDLLRHLAEHSGRVFTREELLAAIWPDGRSGSRTVDVHVRRIRAKVGDAVIDTVRNIGYRLSDRTRVELVTA